MKTYIVILISIMANVIVADAQINIMGTIKNKAEQRVQNRISNAVDKGLDQMENDINGKKKDSAATKYPASSASSTPSNESANPADPKTVLKAYNNYDFVAGNNILFTDDCAGDQDGEFPTHWDLVAGQGVVNTDMTRKYIVLTEGNYAKIKPLIKTDSYLGDNFTIEFDYFSGHDMGDVHIFFSNAEKEEKNISFNERGGVSSNYFEHDLSAEWHGDEGFEGKWHQAALVYKNGQVKCYIDQYRILVMPNCKFKPASIEMGGIAPLRFSNIRIAEGGSMNMPGKILTDGKYICHGITFDINKSTIKPESMGALNELVKFLQENPGVKLSVEGHTDSDGEPTANQKLSEERAGSVRTQLMNMGIDGSRLVSKGFGESKPISDNATPEGKASNRRVEFIKI